VNGPDRTPGPGALPGADPAAPAETPAGRPAAAETRAGPAETRAGPAETRAGPAVTRAGPAVTRAGPAATSGDREGRPAAAAAGDTGAARRVPCAGAIVRDYAGRLLLIRRGQEPGRGLWSLPGGRCEPGEDAATAAVREAYEETGLVVAAGALVGRVERPGPGGVTYVIDDLACAVTGGTLRAGDDADDVRWVGPAELATLPVTDGLLDALTRWGVVQPG